MMLFQSWGRSTPLTFGYMGRAKNCSLSSAHFRPFASTKQLLVPCSLLSNCAPGDHTLNLTRWANAYVGGLGFAGVLEVKAKGSGDWLWTGRTCNATRANPASFYSFATHGCSSSRGHNPEVRSVSHVAALVCDLAILERAQQPSGCAAS
jgi:hypothetical protein